MNNNYNAAVQGGAQTSSLGGIESKKGMSNPLKNRMTVPPIDGLTSRAYSDAMRSIALAQINLGQNIKYSPYMS